MEPNTQEPTPSPKRIILRSLIIGAIIIILIFLSIGIVRIVPKIISSISTATTSLFSNDENTTPATTTSGGFIVMDEKPATTTTVTTKKTVKPANNKVVSYQSAGTPDLAVAIISKGVINPANGIYVETNNFTTSDTVVIKFRINNIGTASGDPFSLSVSMPSSNTADQVRQITSASKIPAGGGIDAQAVFTNPRIGTNLPVVITIDPSNVTRDITRGNNTATAQLNVNQGINYTGVNTGNNIFNGQPDFIVQVMQVGTLNAYDQFTPTTNIPINGRVAVQFRVINQGNNSNITNPWFFRAELTDSPSPNKIYNSGIQAGIIGGQVVTYTIGFDNLRYGWNSITIYADSQNNIYENNESNNIGNISFNVY